MSTSTWVRAMKTPSQARMTSLTWPWAGMKTTSWCAQTDYPRFQSQSRLGLLTRKPGITYPQGMCNTWPLLTITSRLISIRISAFLSLSRHAVVLMLNRVIRLIRYTTRQPRGTSKTYSRAKTKSWSANLIRALKRQLRIQRANPCQMKRASIKCLCWPRRSCSLQTVVSTLHLPRTMGVSSAWQSPSPTIVTQWSNAWLQLA